MTIQEKVKEYILINKELVEMRKHIKEYKKKADLIDADIKEYMTNNDMDSISIPEGEIVMYQHKIAQTFKKDNILKSISSKIKDSKLSEEIAESIVNNKAFTTEDKIKAVIKK
jgi:Zn-dependent M32 family carboxypeptidase